tara:strand:+ start:2542 stop:3051 length:510 start_codon:yes stop_codon:yes gene_type:complete
MKLLVVDPDSNLCHEAYEGDAGIDIKAATEPTILGYRLNDHYWKYIDYIEYDTNIKIQPEDQNSRAVTFLFPRSSVSRHHLILANSVGIIDSGYTDTIKVRFKYVPQPDDYRIHEGKWLLLDPNIDRMYRKGDKIAQLVFSNYLRPEIKMVEELNKTERGTGGFGSSGD